MFGPDTRGCHSNQTATNRAPSCLLQSCPLPFLSLSVVLPLEHACSLTFLLLQAGIGSGGGTGGAVAYVLSASRRAYQSDRRDEHFALLAF